MALSIREVEALPPGKWKADIGRRGAGVLWVKGLSGGGAGFYFRHTRTDGQRDYLPVGSFDRDGRAGLTLEEARERAGELSRRYVAGDRDLRESLEEEARLRQAAEDQRRREEEEKQRATFGAMLNAYIEQLKADEKVSAPEVESSIRLHIEKPWPQLWQRPAAEVTTEEILQVVRRVVETGRLRQADKTRSYIRAAYSAAIRSHQDALYSQSMRDLRIISNPARDLVAIRGSRGVRHRHLSKAELKAYWKHISEMPEPFGPLLRFHLLTGGQRMDQLQRVLMSDLDRSGESFTMMDPKGKREVPRVHTIPLIPPALEAIRQMGGGEFGPHLFTISGGYKGASSWTIRDGQRPVLAAMEESGELENGVFTPGVIRATVETRLAEMAVPREVRGHLQSHGLSGVQERHYNKYEYFDEKKRALERLYEIL